MGDDIGTIILHQRIATDVIAVHMSVDDEVGTAPGRRPDGVEDRLRRRYHGIVDQHDLLAHQQADVTAAEFALGTHQHVYAGHDFGHVKRFCEVLGQGGDGEKAQDESERALRHWNSPGISVTA